MSAYTRYLAQKFGSNWRLQVLYGLIIALTGAGAAQYSAVALHLAAKVDPFAATLANHTFSLITGKLFRRQRNAHPLHVEHLLICQVAVGQHLLLVFVCYSRMESSCQGLG